MHLPYISHLGKKNTSFNRRILHRVLHNHVFQLAGFITSTLEWRRAVLLLSHSSHLTCSEPTPDITNVQKNVSPTLKRGQPSIFLCLESNKCVRSTPSATPVPLTLAKLQLCSTQTCLDNRC